VNPEITTEEKNRQRLRLLIIARVFILTLFLAAAVFIDIKKTVFSVSPNILLSLYIIIALTYILSIIYAWLLKTGRYFKTNIHLQLAVDVLLITYLVYITGGVSSNYSVLYTLLIIYSVIFLERNGGLIVASASGIFYGLLIDLMFYRVIPPLSAIERNSNLDAGDVFVRILVHMVSFYLLVFLASIVVEQEKKTRYLLEEKESAFNQLDLLFRSIIESVDTGVMTIDLQERIKTFNRAAQDITGFALNAVENKKIENVFPEFALLFAEKKSITQFRSRMEIKISGAKGNTVHLGCSISPLKDRFDKQIGNIIIFQDLTEIKLMENNLEKSRRLALIGEMAAGLAHEMRNPLASITGSIQLLEQGANLEPTDKRLMQIILRGKDQLDNFVRDFLLLAKPIPIVRETVDVKQICEEVLDHLKLSNEWKKDVEVIKIYSDRSKAFANSEQIRQIIHNLILNALQAIEEEGQLELEIQTIKLQGISEYAEIKVKDTGCGIEEKDLKNIFEPFFTDKEKGTGLGLAIVSRIVDGYGGKIKVESIVDKGTTFTVWLPGIKE
jgi:two-component system, NtrC family, sensor histidine kinase PilS